MLALLKDAAHEAAMQRLMDSARAAVGSGADGFAAHALPIADASLELLQAALRAPELNTLFDKTRSLVTIYFFVVFVVVCAGADVQAVLAQESVIVRVATLANRLLLNRQIYENAVRAFFRRCCCR